MTTADKILSQASDTFIERSLVYKDNYLKVGAVMAVLHGNDSCCPASSLVGTTDQFNVFHLYELLIVKLTRFANSGLTHKDSIRDLMVYAAMIESLITKEGQDGDLV